MPKMHVAQVTRPNGPFEITEREIPEPPIDSSRSSFSIQAWRFLRSRSADPRHGFNRSSHPAVVSVGSNSITFIDTAINATAGNSSPPQRHRITIEVIVALRSNISPGTRDLAATLLSKSVGREMVKKKVRVPFFTLSGPAARGPRRRRARSPSRCAACW
jgi:hypothetical protein